MHEKMSVLPLLPCPACFAWIWLCSCILSVPCPVNAHPALLQRHSQPWALPSRPFQLLGPGPLPTVAVGAVPIPCACSPALLTATFSSPSHIHRSHCSLATCHAGIAWNIGPQEDLLPKLCTRGPLCCCGTAPQRPCAQVAR